MLTPEQQRKAMAVARAVAEFSECRRLRVGAVLIDLGDNGECFFPERIGYNECLGECNAGLSCGRRANHAEAVALPFDGMTNPYAMVCTHSPCERCLRTIADYGVTHVYYAEEYRIPPNRELAAELGVTLTRVTAISGLYRGGSHLTHCAGGPRVIGCPHGVEASGQDPGASGFSNCPQASEGYPLWDLARVYGRYVMPSDWCRRPHDTGKICVRFAS